MISPPNGSLRCHRLGTIIFADTISLADLRLDPSRVISRAADEHRPVLVTSGGRGVAVVQSLVDYETSEEERAFMRAVVAGLTDLESGREVSFDAAKARLGLK